MSTIALHGGNSYQPVHHSKVTDYTMLYKQFTAEKKCKCSTRNRSHVHVQLFVLRCRYLHLQEKDNNIPKMECLLQFFFFNISVKHEVSV